MAGPVLGAEIESWQSPSPHPSGTHILVGFKHYNTNVYRDREWQTAKNLQKNEREKIHREGIGSEVAEFTE